MPEGFGRQWDEEKKKYEIVTPDDENAAAVRRFYAAQGVVPGAEGFTRAMPDFTQDQYVQHGVPSDQADWVFIGMDRKYHIKNDTVIDRRPVSQVLKRHLETSYANATGAKRKKHALTELRERGVPDLTSDFITNMLERLGVTKSPTGR